MNEPNAQQASNPRPLDREACARPLRCDTTAACRLLSFSREVLASRQTIECFSDVHEKAIFLSLKMCPASKVTSAVEIRSRSVLKRSLTGWSFRRWQFLTSPSWTGVFEDWLLLNRNHLLHFLALPLYLPHSWTAVVAQHTRAIALLSGGCGFKSHRMLRFFPPSMLSYFPSPVECP